MKKTLFLIAIAFLSSCHKDFDEWTDTSQRCIVFTFDAKDYFSDILVTTEEGYALGASATLDPDYELRITGYCYDSTNTLLKTVCAFSDSLNIIDLKFKHLYENVSYHFVFFADIVKYDAEVDYYETWFQLGSNHLEDFYLFSPDRNEKVEYNILLSCSIDTVPSNQTIPVTMQPITYNGYLVFNNLQGIDKLFGYTGYYQSLRLQGLSGIDKTMHDFVYYPHQIDSIVLPITVSHADNKITIKAKTITVTSQDSATRTITNTIHRPFVANFDCATLKLTHFTTY